MITHQQAARPSGRETLGPRDLMISRRSGISCELIAERYAAELLQRTGKPESARHALGSARLYIRSQGPELPTRPRLLAFVRERLEGGASPRTVQGNLRDLRAMLNAAEVPGVARMFQRVAPKATKPLARGISWGKVAEVLRRADAEAPRIAPLIRVVAASGLRLQEAWWLTVGDVDMDAALIHVRAKPGWAPKTHQEREIPCDALLGLLRRYVEGRDRDTWLLEASPGKRWTPGAYYPIAREFFGSLGLRGVHDFRHGLATHLLSQGVSLPDVQDILGHSSLQTTLGYLHSCPRRKRLALSKLAGFN